jgi:hypothetical protein
MDSRNGTVGGSVVTSAERAEGHEGIHEDEIPDVGITVFEDNALSWWKSHGHHFPTLSRFARRFLGIFGTSCPVERLFSVTGQVDDTRRTSLSPDTMTLLVLIHEGLPLVRKISYDRIVDTVRNFN